MAEKIVLVAMTESRIIGRCGTLPWSHPEELKLFRALTMSHVVVMGRRTFQSLAGPLEGRQNIVVSRTLEPVRGVRVCRSFPEAVAAAETYGEKIFFIGGRDIYREALPLADSLAISWIPEDVPGDVRFPAIDFSEWVKVSASQYPGFRHVHYRREKETRDRNDTS